MDGVILGGAIAALAGIAAAVLGPVVAGNVDRRGERQRAETTKAERLETVLARYRDPLSHAAFDLQGRLFNIVRGSFLDRYLLRGDPEEQRYAESSTLWRFGQYLGWTEILRREIQFLDLGSVDRSRRLVHLQTQIRRAFQHDGYPTAAFRLFGDEQRGAGESMIVSTQTSASGSRVSVCLGYADFLVALEAGDLGGWTTPLARDIREVATDPAGRARLVELQHHLVELVRFLDPDQVRFPADELELA